MSDARKKPSTWSVLRARLLEHGGGDLVERMAPECEAYRCSECGRGDPVVMLAEGDDAQPVMVCLHCNRDTFERQGYELPCQN